MLVDNRLHHFVASGESCQGGYGEWSRSKLWISFFSDRWMLPGTFRYL